MATTRAVTARSPSVVVPVRSSSARVALTHPVIRDPAASVRGTPTVRPASHGCRSVSPSLSRFGGNAPSIGWSAMSTPLISVVPAGPVPVVSHQERCTDPSAPTDAEYTVRPGIPAGLMPRVMDNGFASPSSTPGAAPVPVPVPPAFTGPAEPDDRALQRQVRGQRIRGCAARRGAPAQHHGDGDGRRPVQAAGSWTSDPGSTDTEAVVPTAVSVLRMPDPAGALAPEDASGRADVVVAGLVVTGLVLTGCSEADALAPAEPGVEAAVLPPVIWIRPYTTAAEQSRATTRITVSHRALMVLRGGTRPVCRGPVMASVSNR